MKRFGFLLMACVGLLAATGWGQGAQMPGAQGPRRSPFLNRRAGRLGSQGADQQSATSDEEAKEALK